MRSFFYVLFDPVTIHSLLLIFFIVAYIKKRNLHARIWLILAITWFFAVGISPLPQWIVHALESRYTTIDLQNIEGREPDVVLILGGGHAISPSLAVTDQLSKNALGRLVEALRIKRQYPSCKIVSSGYSRSGRISQAEMLAFAGITLGLDAQDTLMLISPANTAEEAVTFVSRFGRQQQFILVTDAVHMPRAMKIFLNNGLNPIPAPTNHYIKIDPQESTYHFKPSTTKILMMEAAIHEYVGLLEVFLFG